MFVTVNALLNHKFFLSSCLILTHYFKVNMFEKQVHKIPQLYIQRSCKIKLITGLKIWEFKMGREQN